jgi:predicted transcriptional regulator
MKNSDAFLNEYAKIEKWLRNAMGANRGLTFSILVDRMAERDRTVRRFLIDLKEYGDLRNAIVHERSDGHVIAEPNDRALNHIKQICKSLTDPPLIIPKFQGNVEIQNSEDSVGEAVRVMKEGFFSQLPILQGESVVAVLTAETVTRWLAHEYNNDLVSLSGTTISRVLCFTEDEEHYCFLSRQSTMLDALDRFEQFTARGKKLDAILITHDGKSNQKLLGIVTIFDIPIILAELGLQQLSTI